MEDTAASLTADIQALYPTLQIYFIIHRRGQRQDQVEKILPRLQDHPAYDAALDLLKSRNTSEQSTFFGIALGHEKRLFGFTGKAVFLSFVSLNLDQYEDADEARYALLHMTGQFLDLMSTIGAETVRSSGEIVLQPKRNPLSVARINMKADIFSALMMTSEGHTEAVRELARLRGVQALLAQPYQKPEEYPYPISIDVAEFAAQKLRRTPASSLLRSAHQLSSGVCKTFDRQNFESWMNFTNPAQTMAWSGNTPEHILGAAIHTSSNPFIKSIGNLVAEVTHLEPVTKDQLQTGYNPYVELEINQIAHDRHVEDTFEMIMVHSMEADSALPLVRVANNQNESMLKGRTLGWCAHALHASAKAFQQALERGAPAQQAARLEFESAKNQTDWKILNRVTDHILHQRRHGFAVTMSDLVSWCKHSVDFRPVLESLQQTLDDPGYHRKLSAANEMPVPDPSYQAPSRSVQPAPLMQPVFAPQLALGGSMGGLNVGGLTQRIARTLPASTDLATESE